MNSFYVMEEKALNEYLDNREKVSKYNQNDFRADYYSALEKTCEEWQDILTFNGATAIIEVKGVLVNRKPDIFDAFCGMRVCNYADVKNAIYQILDTDVKDVIVEFDTPGGMVSGVEACKDELNALSELVNVTPVNVGMCCSGGVWLSSGIGRPVMGNNMSIIGSIGVVTTVYDDSKLLEDYGVKRYIITNTDSPDKIPDVSKEKGRNLIKKELDDIYNVFATNVEIG